MKKLLSTIAIAGAVVASAPAAAQTVQVNWVNAPLAIPANNDFQSQLNGLGLTSYVSGGASLILSGPATITFEFLGSESGFSDTFTAGGTTYTENTMFINRFGSPINIGTTAYFAGGSLAGLLNFTSSGGVSATVGHDGFGIFLLRGQQNGASVNEFYLGYDDQINNQDDNHDDMIIRARVGAPVPEPGTWAMMLLGFGMVGYGLRFRRRSTRLAQVA